MNGFPRIELEGLGNNKAVCQQVICSAAGMQRELEKLFHRSSFPGDAGGHVVNKKEKKRLERESEFRFSHSWRRFALFFWISFFFLMVVVLLIAVDQKLYQLIKACTLNAIG